MPDGVMNDKQGDPSPGAKGDLRRKNPVQYNARGVEPAKRDHGAAGAPRSRVSGVAVTGQILAGMALGAGVGLGIDWLAGLMPLLTIVGMCAGLGFSLYAIYLESR
jgi:F0F1-type ATP synthase assembly protein I